MRDLNYDDIGRLSVDEDSRICLDGKPIEVKNMTLTKWQAIVAVSMAILGSLSAATIAILQFWITYKGSCSRRLSRRSYPAQVMLPTEVLFSGLLAVEKSPINPA